MFSQGVYNFLLFDNEKVNIYICEICDIEHFYNPRFIKCIKILQIQLPCIPVVARITQILKNIFFNVVSYSEVRTSLFESRILHPDHLKNKNLASFTVPFDI